MRVFVISIVLFVLGFLGPVAAFERGEIAYVCSKNQKFGWVLGQDSWTACPVRILQKAGGSYKVLAHQKSCLMSRASMISRGHERWVESYQLWGTRSSCEQQGKKSKPKAAPQDTSIKITNKCPRPLHGFVYYKNLSGSWVKGKSFNIPADGKVYEAWDAKTKSRIIEYYIQDPGNRVRYGSGNGTTVTHEGKTVRLSRFEAAKLPVHMVFCQKR